MLSDSVLGLKCVPPESRWPELPVSSMKMLKLLNFLCLMNVSCCVLLHLELRFCENWWAKRRIDFDSGGVTTVLLCSPEKGLALLLDIIKVVFVTYPPNINVAVKIFSWSITMKFVKNCIPKFFYLLPQLTQKHPVYFCTDWTDNKTPRFFITSFNLQFFSKQKVRTTVSNEATRSPQWGVKVADYLKSIKHEH